MPASKSRKLKTGVALDLVLLEWVDDQVKRKRFANRTHAIEYAIQRLKDSV